MCPIGVSSRASMGLYLRMYIKVYVSVYLECIWAQVESNLEIFTQVHLAGEFEASEIDCDVKFQAHGMVCLSQ
jgi:hypothetical protein